MSPRLASRMTSREARAWLLAIAAGIAVTAAPDVPGVQSAPILGGCLGAAAVVPPSWHCVAHRSLARRPVALASAGEALELPCVHAGHPVPAVLGRGPPRCYQLLVAARQSTMSKGADGRRPEEAQADIDRLGGLVCGTHQRRPSTGARPARPRKPSDRRRSANVRQAARVAAQLHVRGTARPMPRKWERTAALRTRSGSTRTAQ
jgi:hypothetical protein